MTEFVEDVGLTEAFKAVFQNKSYSEFVPLRENKLRILPIMKVKTNSEGEHQASSGPPAVLKKVPDMMKAAGVEADYILVVDYYAWNHPKGINPQMAQESFIHHALMSIEVEKVQDKKGQDQVKVANRPLDVEEYLETAKRYGGVVEEHSEFAGFVIAGAQAMKQIANGSVADEKPHVEAEPVAQEPAAEPESAEEPAAEEAEEPAPAVRRRGRAK